MKFYQNVLLITSGVVAVSLSSILVKISSGLAKEDPLYSFNTSAMVLYSELLKLAISIYFTAYSGDSFRFNKKELPLYVIPAFLYFVGNNLMFVAVSGVDPGSLLLLSNLKIFTTAMFSWLLLKTKFSLREKLSLLSLFIGCVISQLPQNDQPMHATKDGLLAVVVACTTSGAATAYTELLLKQSNTSFHKQNIQLYSVGLLFCVLSLYAGDISTMLDGLDKPLNIAVLVSLSISGMVLGAIMKYLSSIAKTYLRSVATIVVAVFSIYLFDTEITLNGVIGYFIILISLYVYTNKSK